MRMVVVVVDLVKWRKRMKKNVSRKSGLKAF